MIDKVIKYTLIFVEFARIEMLSTKYKSSVDAPWIAGWLIKFTRVSRVA